MPLNSDKPHLWKADVAWSIDFYNDWFIRFAPETYRRQRVIRTREVLDAFQKTGNLAQVMPAVLRDHPGLLPIFRMATAPPLARDRLMGLAYVNKAMIGAMEGKDNTPPRLPSRMQEAELAESLVRICDIVTELADRDLLPWLDAHTTPPQAEVDRAATVIADRLCGAAADPIIRNAQEKRQLAALRRWLRRQGYQHVRADKARDLNLMPPGTFTFHLSLPAGREAATVSIPVDCVVRPFGSTAGDLPVMIEAKSAGDATNTNKRRKEEAQKFAQLKERYGVGVQFVLLLCGYFEPGYLGYEASEGIDWVWEHRLDDFALILPRADLEGGPAAAEAEGLYSTANAGPEESSRFSRQRDTDAAKSQEERNRLGQFSTPYPLARQIVSGAVQGLVPAEAIRFLEPALGSGVFFSALLGEAGPLRIEEAMGVEVDESYARIAMDTFQSRGLTVEILDFLEFAARPENRSRFNLLCTNPPYVRHHHLDARLKQQLHGRVQRDLGLEVSGLAGLYVYFVLLADALLRPDAVASWLLPAEFLYVNYGKCLRDYLTKNVTLIGIHHFDSEEVQFDDALVSSCVVTYRKKRPMPGGSFAFSVGSSISAPEAIRVLDTQECHTEAKWTLLNFDSRHDTATDTVEQALGDLFDIKRGIATGSNGFFILSPSVADEYVIPREFLRPILPSPRYLAECVIEGRPDGSPCIDNYGLLLDCDLPPEVVRTQHPGLWSYLQTGIQRGINERYLCAGRGVWYSQEKRSPSMFLATYMGRSDGHSRSPVRFALNLSAAIVTNVYLHLYPKASVLRLLKQDDRRPRELLNTLNAIPMDDILRAGRAYGGGLYKIEPKELRGVPVRDLPEWLIGVVLRQPLLI